MNRSVKNSIIAGFSVFAATALVLTPFSPLATAANENIVLCHLTKSKTNPWVVQSVKANQLQSHLANGDFLYAGPVDSHGHPTNAAGAWCAAHVTSTPTPTPSSTPTPTPSDTPTPTPSDTPTPTPSDTPTPTPSDTPTPTPSNDPTPTPTPFNDPTPTPTPSDTPTPTPSDTPTPTPTPTPTHHHSGGNSGSLGETPTPTPTPEPSETPVVLGASTQLPATGLSVTDALILALCAGIFTSGLVLTASSANRA